MGKKKPTIRDIAEMAGVSVATVSGVLNNKGRYTPATSAKIREVMKETGYVPRRNKLREPPPTGENSIHSVCLLFPDTNKRGTRTPLGAGLIKGVVDSLGEQNIPVVVRTLNRNGTLPDDVLDGTFKGLIVRQGVIGEHEEVYEQIEASGLFTVWVFGTATKQDAVMVDNRSCGDLVGQKAISAENRDMIVVLPATGRNVDLEIRALCFEMYVDLHGVPHRKFSTENITPEQTSFPFLKTKSPKTIFVPGHDAEVMQIYNHITKLPAAKKKNLQLIATMTKDVPLKRNGLESLDLLLIDPYRVGFSAGRQMISRWHTPWGEPFRILVPPKVSSKS